MGGLAHYAPMAHLQTDGAQVFSLWHNGGMTGYPKFTRAKRPRDPAQLAKLMIDIASGEVEDREPTTGEHGKATTNGGGDKNPRKRTPRGESSTKSRCRVKATREAPID